MIASLTGRLTRKTPTQIILNVRDVGYEVFIPLSSYYVLPEISQTVELHIYTQVKEDSIQLFGFSTQEEKDAFVLLTAVSGIGSKLALGILSSLPVPDLIAAIKKEDLEALHAVPGIGKKTAARMALELRDKVNRLDPTPTTSEQVVSSRVDGLVEDALSALVNLGYRSQDGKAVLQRLCNKEHPLPQLQELIRGALKELSGGKI